MSISLKRLEKKKLDLGINKLSDAGIDVERWLAMCNADTATMQRIEAVWPGAVIFKARRVGNLLGVETPDSPAPAAMRPDERIIYLPPSITSPTALRGTKAPMRDQDWYDNCGYTAKSGYWGVILPVPESNLQTQQLQDKQILEHLPGYQRTPMLIDTLLLSLELLMSGKDLLKGDYVRCPEQAPTGYRVELLVHDGRLLVSDGWASVAGGDVWSSAARWISD